MTISILIIEDDKIKMDDISNHIQESSTFNIDLSFSDSVDSALDHLVNFSVDLVILDLNLPMRSNGNAIEEGGETILDALVNDEYGIYNRPTSVFGISQHKDLHEKYSDKFSELSFTLNYYSPITTDWKTRLTSLINWLSANNAQSSTRIRKSEKLIISVHGIRTEANWQKKLDKLVNESNSTGVSCRNYNYGFFDLVRFIFPHTRKKEVEKFSKHVKSLVRIYEKADVTFIGHSFGTYLIGYFLESLKLENSVRIDKIILISSVLPSDFPWHKIREIVSINTIINDCGIKDKVLLLSQALVPGTGMAGRVGFHGFIDSAFQNRYFDAGHDLYETIDDYFERYCLPLILKSEVISSDVRDNKWVQNFINSLFRWMSTTNIFLFTLLVLFLMIL